MMRACAPFAMPTGGSKPDLLVDTSVAVALVVSDHEHHEATLRAIGTRKLGLAGDARVETFSVLARLPFAHLRPPHAVVKLVAEYFPQKRRLSPAPPDAL